MAEHVHAFLSGTAERLWDAYRQETGRSSNLDRQAYLAGVMRGFEAKLAAQSADFKEQGIVWVPNSPCPTPPPSPYIEAHGPPKDAIVAA